MFRMVGVILCWSAFLGLAAKIDRLDRTLTELKRAKEEVKGETQVSQEGKENV